MEKQKSILLDARLMQSLKVISAQRGVSMKSLLEKALWKMLEEYEDG